MHVSNRLVQTRKSKGHTLTDAAKTMGIGRHTVHCVEAGKKFPRPKTLEILSQYYGLSEIAVLKTVLVERKRRERVSQIDRDILAELSV